MSDAGWTPECTVEMHRADKGDPDEEIASYLREAEEDGHCLVFHHWPADADDAGEDDAGGMDPPGERDRELASIAGAYVTGSAEDTRVLVLGTDRHFGGGEGGLRESGTWHVDGTALTLAYFPAPGSKKAMIDGPWRVAPDAPIGPKVTLRRRKT